MRKALTVEPATAVPSAVGSVPRERSMGPTSNPFVWIGDEDKLVLSDVLAEWRAIAQGAPPILTPEFVLPTARLLGLREIVLCGARRAGTLVAALPMVRHGRTLHALRSEHTPRIDLVGETSSVAAVWGALQQAGAWDLIELQSVPADSPLAVTLPALAAADGCEVRVRETSRPPWFLVDGIEQRIHRRFRGDMRRLERQLGGVELERVTAFDRGAIDEVLRLEAAAWKGVAGTAITCDAKLTRFYETIAQLFAARGALSIAFLRARGVRIAAQFALEDATTRYLMKVGYDPAYAHYGPGQLLVRETAADAARRGLQRYDLMGKDTPWKTKWTDLARPHVQVRLYAPSMLGRVRHFVHEVARPMAGSALRALRGKHGRDTHPHGTTDETGHAAYVDETAKAARGRNSAS
jgi:CelD/BcsL family acetyltransferase involved in cellulose biosynthesis